MKGSEVRRNDIGAPEGAGVLTVCPGRGGLALSRLQKVALVLVAVGLLSAGAWISVPFYPVPLTMQTLAVLLVGGFLGPTLGASAVAVYVALGVAGAPVFHSGLAGPAVLAGPTGGYLIGFIAAAFLMGLAVKRAGQVGTGGTGATARGRGRRVSLTGWASLLVLIGGAVAAGAAIYALGVSWLAVFTGGDLRSALTVGFMPFLLGDLLKGAVAIGALRLGGDALARRGFLLP